MLQITLILKTDIPEDIRKKISDDLKYQFDTDRVIVICNSSYEDFIITNLVTKEVSRNGKT
jgi:hypothetical protein